MARPRIAIVDTGSGNLRSVEKALAAGRCRRLRHARRRRRWPRADKVVLPGQGAFGAYVAGLDRGGGALRAGGAGRDPRGQALPRHLHGPAGPVRRQRGRAGLRRARRAARPGGEVQGRAAAQGAAHGLERLPAARRRRRRRRCWPTRPTAPTSTSCTATIPVPADPRDVALLSDHGGDFCAAVAARQPLRLPVPPGEEPARRAWRCSARFVSMLEGSPMQVFPAIDLLDGKAVRLRTGPAARAPRSTRTRPGSWRGASPRPARPRLHVVDLDAALSGGAKHNHATIEKILGAAGTHGGRGRRRHAHPRGLRARLRARAPATRCMGTAAIKTPEVVEEACRRYPQRIVVAVDARAGKVAVEGWKEDTQADALGHRHGRWPRRARRPCSTPTSAATACARDPTSKPRRAWRAPSRPARSSPRAAWPRWRTSTRCAGTGAAAVVIGKALYERRLHHRGGAGRGGRAGGK